MSPLIERFVSLVLASFGSRRDKLGPAAREQLMSHLQAREGAPGQQAALATACDSLEKRRPRSSISSLGRVLLLTVAPILIFLGMVWYYLPDLFLLDPPSWFPASQLGRIENRQASLALRPLPEAPRRKLALKIPLLSPREPDPNNPEDIQIQTIKALGYSHGVLPSGWSEVWRKADPQNAWYLLQEAARLSNKLRSPTSRSFSPYSAPKSPAAPLDPSTVEQILALCEEAARLPCYIDYTEGPHLRQFACLRTPDSVTEDKAEESLRPDEFFISLVSLRLGLLHIAEEKDAAGDSEGALHVAKLLRHLILMASMQAGAGEAEWNGSVDPFFPGFMKPAPLARKAPAALLPVLGDIEDRVNAVRARTATDFDTLLADKKAEDTGLATHRYPAVPPAMDHLRPMRLLDYIVKARVFAWAISFASAVIVLLVLAMLRQFSLLSAGAAIGRRLSILHAPVSQLRVFLFGLLIPTIWWWCIIWHTPLGLRDINAGGILYSLGYEWMSGYALPGQILSGLLLVLTASLFQARREVARRFAFLDIRPPDLLTGWLPLVLAFVAPALFGVARWAGSDAQENCEKAAAATAGLAAAVVLWRLISPFYFLRATATGALLTARLVVPVIATLSLAASLSISLLALRERHYLAEFPGDYRTDRVPWLHQHTQAFRVAIREEFANEPPYIGE